MLACVEHAAHFGLRERSRIDRNMGVEYAENINKLGGSGAAVDEGSGICVKTLMASSAWRTPMTPTTGPNMPPSPHETTDSGGGGFGNTHR